MSKKGDFLKEVKNLSEADLERRLRELRESLRELSFRTHSSEIRDTHKFTKTRKQIATILTILNQRRRINRPSRKNLPASRVKKEASKG